MAISAVEQGRLARRLAEIRPHLNEQQPPLLLVQMRPDLRQPARQPTLLHCADRHTTTLWDLSRQIVAYWCAIAKEGWKGASSGLDLVTDRTMYDGRIDGTAMYYGGPGNNNCPPSAAPNTGSGSNPGSGESPHGQGAGGRPVLIPVSSSAEPECGAADFDGSVMNQTSVPTDSFRVAWVVDGAIVKTGTVSDLPPRVAKSGLSVHQYLSPGEHIVKFVVDDTNLIAESDESNNTWTDRVTVPTCRSSPAQPVTPALPNPPSNLTVLSTDSYHIRISWQDDSNNEPSFEVNNGNESRTVGRNVTSYVWSSTPGSYMCVRVRAVNSAGASPWEPSVSPFYRCTTTPGANNPTTPTQSTPNPSTNLTTPDGTPCTGPLGQNGVIRNGQCYLGTAM